MQTKVVPPLLTENPRYPRPNMKVKVKRWHCVAVWKWEIDDEVCGICRMPFESCCPGVKFPGDDCPPVWGQCGHALHMQCLMKWLESQQNARQECPLCRQVSFVVLLVFDPFLTISLTSLIFLFSYCQSSSHGNFAKDEMIRIHLD